MDLNVTKDDLEKFIQDKDLEILEVELNKFNFFDVFQYKEKETFHSKIIAWLLNPKETHGLKDYFLKKFLIKVLSLPINKSNSYNNISSIDIDILDLDNSFVQTEEKFDSMHRSDISILDEDNKIYILIENKILSTEGKDQTKNYLRESKKRYPDFKYIFIYLTKNGDSPESSEFIICTYSDIIDLLNNLLESSKINLSNELTIFIKEYLRHLKTNIMNDSNIEELCLNIYQNHSKAVEAIFNIRPTNKLFYEKLGQEVVNTLKDDWSFYYTNSFCTVFKKKWIKKYRLNSNMPFIHYEFNNVGSSSKVSLGIHVERYKDVDVREEFKKILRNYIPRGYKFTLNNVQVIYSERTLRLTEINDTVVFKKITNKMIKLIRDTSNNLDNAYNKL